MIIYNVAMASWKMTFLFQFDQIFRYVYVMRIVYTVAIFIVAAWSIAQIFLAVCFLSRPVGIMASSIQCVCRASSQHISTHREQF